MVKIHKVKKSCFFLGQYFEFGEILEVTDNKALIITKQGHRIPLGELTAEIPAECFDGVEETQNKDDKKIVVINQREEKDFVSMNEFKDVIKRLAELEKTVAEFTSPEPDHTLEILTEERIKEMLAEENFNTKDLSLLAEKNFGNRLVLGGGKTTENIISQYLEAQKSFLEQPK